MSFALYRAGSENPADVGIFSQTLSAPSLIRDAWSAAETETRIAILVFNRGMAASTVLAGVRERTESHPNRKRKRKRMTEWKHESGYRYVFHRPGDTNRELTLTVLVFDVPEDPGKRG
jgi:hypothetical protein